MKVKKTDDKMEKCAKAIIPKKNVQIKRILKNDKFENMKGNGHTFFGEGNVSNFNTGETKNFGKGKVLF